MQRTIPYLAAGLTGLALVFSASAHAADNYPTQPIRIVVPTTAGGAADIMTRKIAKKLSESMNVAVVIENKPGAGNTIGSNYVAHSPPDGYTLLMTYTDHVFNPYMYASLPYDTRKGFEPVTFVGEVPMVLVVNPKVKVTTIHELTELAKAEPGKLNYASAGNGTSLHLAAVLFTSMADIDVMHIPYKGTSPGLVDLLGGRVQFMFPTLVSIDSSLKDGTVRALAVTSAKRVPGNPDLPTISETPGLEGYEASIWYAVLAPAGTPKDIIAKLNSEFHKALGSPDLKSELEGQGFSVAPGTPEELAEKIDLELDRWGKVIRENNISLN
ncbi:tripartite tricarboxylate transporter substrate binding protein [Alcaligenaceae bacterium]|nr:tripartite tricarboxylate transporter substrate binding protein [Alcaligenaceae bacterium]